MSTVMFMRAFECYTVMHMTDMTHVRPVVSNSLVTTFRHDRCGQWHVKVLSLATFASHPVNQTPINHYSHLTSQNHAEATLTQACLPPLR